MTFITFSILRGWRFFIGCQNLPLFKKRLIPVWLRLAAIKQWKWKRNLVWEWTNKLNFNFLLLLSARERNAVFSNLPILSAFFEWHFREHEHLKRENGNEMEKYLLLANRQCIEMNNIRNECCFQWDLECLIKSNQIKSNHTFQYHISHIIVNPTLISLNMSEWRKI